MEGNGDHTATEEKDLTNVAKSHATSIDRGGYEEELNEIRKIWKTIKREQKEKRELQKEKGLWAQAEWCCRCKIMTKFLNEQCVTKYCQHNRCYYCRNFNETE